MANNTSAGQTFCLSVQSLTLASVSTTAGPSTATHTPAPGREAIEFTSGQPAIYRPDASLHLDGQPDRGSAWLIATRLSRRPERMSALLQQPVTKIRCGVPGKRIDP